MELIDWIYAISAGLSAFAAVLAWIAKIRWSNEYKEAKDEVIRAKDAHIAMLQNEVENLQALTPVKMREYFEVTTNSLDEFVGVLQTQLEDAKTTVQSKEEEIKGLESQNRKVGSLQQEKEILTEAVGELAGEVEDLSTQLKSLRGINRTIPTINISQVARAAIHSSSAVATLLADQQTQMQADVMHSMERLRSQIGPSLFIDPLTKKPYVQQRSPLLDGIDETSDDAIE